MMIVVSGAVRERMDRGGPGRSAKTNHIPLARIARDFNPKTRLFSGKFEKIAGSPVRHFFGFQYFTSLRMASISLSSSEAFSGARAFTSVSRAFSFSFSNVPGNCALLEL